MKTLSSLVLLLFSLLSLAACKKQQISPCAGKEKLVVDFVIKEHVGQQMFSADTVYRDNEITFEAIGDYDSVRWKIGEDPRKFTKEKFTLSFHNTLGDITVHLTAFKKPAADCFAESDGVYELTKTFTVVEQFDKIWLKKSPLVGKYKGYNEGSPRDTFTVRIEYFDNEKYSTSYFGSNNFYWISNLPNGYYWDQGSQAFGNPELYHGQQMEMGYKSFSFGNTTCASGYGQLSNDTLYVNYGSDVGNCKKRFIGIKQ